MFGTFLIDIALILVISQVFGKLFRSLGQPPVIGQIIAGIFLGPSLIGHALPSLSATVFSQGSLSLLEAVSNLGLVLYLFLVGSELNTTYLDRRRRTTVMIVSFSGMFLPFVLGLLLAGSLYRRYSLQNTSATSFALFIATAFSITAFPVLVQIIRQLRMEDTPLGVMAILCASADDVTAWFLLSIVVTLISPGEGGNLLSYKALGIVLYFGFMFIVFRPLAGRIVKRLPTARMTENQFVLSLLCLVLSAGTTDKLGIHAYTGAFIAGIVFPKIPEWQMRIKERIEPLASGLFLPLFFALSGLRTQTQLLPGNWLWLTVILLVAIVGKFGGASIAGLVCGLEKSEAAALGILLNARGLVELIVLNVGYQAG